jgi:hypothetical protein
MMRLTHSASLDVEFTPEKLCIVVPRIEQAATPVVAVKTIFRGESKHEHPAALARSSVCRMCDLPDPAGPVKKTE